MDHPCNYLNLRREAAQPANLAAVPTGMPSPCLLTAGDGTVVFYSQFGARTFGFYSPASAAAWPVLLGSNAAVATVGAAGDGADVDLQMASKGNSNTLVVTNSVTRLTINATAAVFAVPVKATRIQAAVASSELAGIVNVPVGGSATVTLTSIGADDVVICTPLQDSTGAAGVGTSVYAVVNAGGGFTVNCKPVPASGFDCAYVVIRRV